MAKSGSVGRRALRGGPQPASGVRRPRVHHVIRWVV